jgi:hypothetical protein
LQEKYKNIIHFSKIRILISSNENKVDIGIDAHRGRGGKVKKI